MTPAGSSEDHSSWWSETPRLIHRGPRRPSMNWLAWVWLPWRRSTTASSLAPLPQGPTPCLAEIMIGAPAGQPEFAEWATLLGGDSAAIPFLRYLPERLS